MKNITYNLKLNNETSTEYYNEIKAFSTIFCHKSEETLGSVLDEFMLFIEKNSIETPRSRAEYMVELLTLAMTWNRYLGASQHTSRFLINTLRFLFNLRRKYLWIKPHVDKLRGLLTSTYIVPSIQKEPTESSFSITNFKRLIDWLEASGEFKDETKRLKNWYQYFVGKSQNNQIPSMEAILTNFIWFRDEAKLTFGKYTENLSHFLNTEYRNYKFREDVIFCGKEEVEYHVNMVGSEIMNHGFSSNYKKTSHKVLLVPGCMRPNNGIGCMAHQKGLDITCSHCNTNCKIHQLTSLGFKNNYETYIVPHSSSFTKWLKRWENSTDPGLIAVACLLNLVPGGYEMRELNIPAQCLLLDFCGCKKHWHPIGISTDLNTARLLKLVHL